MKILAQGALKEHSSMVPRKRTYMLKLVVDRRFLGI